MTFSTIVNQVIFITFANNLNNALKDEKWMDFVKTWVAEVNSKHSHELGTGTFRKARRISVLPPEKQIEVIIFFLKKKMNKL